LFSFSPVKFPVSVYSVSLDLVISVGFWDTGPESIGEDMHMYLKCFFGTKGEMVVRSIFSPSSQSNVEGDAVTAITSANSRNSSLSTLLMATISNGIGGIGGLNEWKEWMSGVKARYGQAKRHHWGSLDSGYAIHRTIMWIFSYLFTPSTSSSSSTSKSLKPFSQRLKETASTFLKVSYLLYTLTEAHIFMGHLVVLNNLSLLLIPSSTYSLSILLSKLLWNLLFGKGALATVDLGVLEWGLGWASLIRLSCLLPNMVMVWHYEKYHEWVGVKRWEYQPKAEVEGESGSVSELTQIPHPLKKGAVATVQYLGLRSCMISPRGGRLWLDWLLAPVAAAVFYIGPQFEVQMSHVSIIQVVNLLPPQGTGRALTICYLIFYV
jgi:hypothetical protein